MIEPGLVSVILPVWNRGDMLREAVASVQRQTHRSVELLIVDDGSTDETLSVARELERSDPGRIRVFSVENGGPGHAREAARLEAHGEFVQYLDSDDLLEPRKFEWQVAALTADLEYVASYGPTAHEITGYGNVFPMRRTGEQISTLFPSMLRDRWWPTASPLYRRSALDEIGPWLPLRLNEDWEYDCRLAALRRPVHWCPERVATMRGHPGHQTSRRRRLDPVALADQAAAAASILRSARTAGVSEDEPDFQHFARRLFFLSRSCAAVGLIEQAQSLHGLAGAALRDKGALKKHRIFERIARMAGWKSAGLISLGMERIMARKSP